MEGIAHLNSITHIIYFFIHPVINSLLHTDFLLVALLRHNLK